MKIKMKFDKIKSKLDPELVKDIEEMGIDSSDLEVCRKDSNNIDIEDIELKGIKLEEGSRTVVRYVSTRTVDQTGDIIIPKGVDFTQFKKTGMPVFFNHNYSIPQIGRDIDIKRDAYGIKVTQQYADTGEGTLADILWKLTKQNMNKQSSVGIIPISVIRKGDRDFEPMMKDMMKEYPELRKSKDKVHRIIAKSVLFEHSDVSLACNTDTDVLAVSKMFIDNGADEKLLKQLGFPLNLNKDKDGDNKNDIDIENKNNDIENLDNIIEKDLSIKELEEIKELEVKKSKITLVKESDIIKTIYKPEYTLDNNEIKSIIKEEIRKKMGRLL